MKTLLVIVIVVVIAVLFLGGSAAFTVMHELGVGIHDLSSLGDIMDKSNSISSSSNSGSDIVKEIVKDNSQNGEGSYKEVTYKDGGFRQYDTKTGELIGSSYDSDQAKLNKGDFD